MQGPEYVLDERTEQLLTQGTKGGYENGFTFRKLRLEISFIRNHPWMKRLTPFPFGPQQMLKNQLWGVSPLSFSRPQTEEVPLDQKAQNNSGSQSRILEQRARRVKALAIACGAGDG
ncbi:hypothetical protein PAAG_11752 [Paracoccidioides lutzii Pb01]|uniref:Uncharacterized protein n=1 Tax=Paracoccidioides lutzii (strain ATCC MYA-826 / Pb01) TaxID=502779 RepID=A0A0A2V125_PARBA|nr:hypothetical protein PAAG_11752 [Paracoccidioides lutzii Pb01]KGQ01516.1 hypothetical protein PAAG_11752 [Paracoccidioides lutzii Pb01]